VIGGRLHLEKERNGSPIIRDGIQKKGKSSLSPFFSSFLFVTCCVRRKIEFLIFILNCEVVVDA
jgi:hypothetical protein